MPFSDGLSEFSDATEHHEIISWRYLASVLVQDAALFLDPAR